MKRRLEGMVGGVARTMWVMTFHAACGRILRREAPRLGYKSNFTIYDQADQVRVVEAVPRRARPRSEAVRPAGYPRADLEREEHPRRRGGVPGSGGLVLRPDRGRRLRALPAEALRLERARLRRHAHAHGPGAGAVPGGSRALAEGLPLRPRGRVPGHEPRAVPAAPAPGRRAQERLRGRRPRPVDLCVPRRRHPQHPRVRAGLRRGQGDPARAELPLHELDPRGSERGHLAQPRAQAEEPLERARRGRAGARARGRGRARRGAVCRLRDRIARRSGLRELRDRDLLPDERAITGDRRVPRDDTDPVPGDRRAALLRAGGDQGRRRLPPGDRQPSRRGLPLADRQPAQAGDRRHDDRPPGHVRRRPEHLAVGGSRPCRRGGRRDGAAEGGGQAPHCCSSR